MNINKWFNFRLKHLRERNEFSRIDELEATRKVYKTELTDKLAEASFTCTNNNGCADVTIRFQTLEQAQEFHKWLVENRKEFRESVKVGK